MRLNGLAGVIQTGSGARPDWARREDKVLMRVLCDFDGTITRTDTTLMVLDRLADNAWRDLESDWVAGRIGSAACMAGQIALVRGSDGDLDRLLNDCELEEGFLDFVAWCSAQQIEVGIVSDGVDRFIAYVLARHGLGHLSVTANRLTGRPGTRTLEHPPRPEDCASGAGVCKCAVASAAGVDSGPLVFIGDGRSDFCISGRADILFAKAQLAAHARLIGLTFHPFDTFHDVMRVLAGLGSDFDIKAFQPTPA